MKKLLAAALTFSFLLFPALTWAQKAETVKKSRILIAFYSWGGNTRTIAETIRKTTGGTLFEIQCVKPYPKDFKSCVKVARKDIKTGTPIKAFPDVSKYDVIFVGSPNWFGTMAPPVRTFLARKELAGKTIFPFFTHGSGGMQNCERDVKALCKKQKLFPALALPGKDVKKAAPKVQNWIKKYLKITK